MIKRTKKEKMYELLEKNKDWKVIDIASSNAGWKQADVFTDIIDRSQYYAKKYNNQKMFGLPFMPSTNIRLPFNDKRGQAMYMNMARWVPGGDIFEQKSGEGSKLPFLLNLYSPVVYM